MGSSAHRSLTARGGSADGGWQGRCHDLWVGPLEQEIAGLLGQPAGVPDRDWMRGDGHPPDAEMRMSLLGLDEEQREEYLFVRVNALGDALRRIAQAIDELRGEADSGS